MPYEIWGDWCVAFKHREGKYNEKLGVSEDGTSFLKFLDLELLRRAYADKVNPEGLVEEFAIEFNIYSYLPE